MSRAYILALGFLVVAIAGMTWLLTMDSPAHGGIFVGLLALGTLGMLGWPQDKDV